MPSSSCFKALLWVQSSSRLPARLANRTIKCGMTQKAGTNEHRRIVRLTSNGFPATPLTNKESLPPYLCYQSVACGYRVLVRNSHFCPINLRPFHFPLYFQIGKDSSAIKDLAGAQRLCVASPAIGESPRHDSLPPLEKHHACDAAVPDFERYFTELPLCWAVESGGPPPLSNTAGHLAAGVCLVDNYRGDHTLDGPPVGRFPAA